MSAPHEPSLNELVDKEEFSLQYVSTDDAVKIIKISGVKSWLIKADITDAFRVMPFATMLWSYHGIKWEDKVYFFNKLVFGCRSSPRIFDTLSQAICWTAKGNYNIKNVLHLLDDFFVILPEEANAGEVMNTFVNIYKNLGIPLSAKKG